MNISCSPATFEALRTILDHEHIAYTTGLGPGVFAITIDKCDTERVNIIVNQWYSAIYNIRHQLGAIE